MNAALKAEAVYGDAQTSVKSPKQVEYLAIARITKGLRAAAETEDDDYPNFVGALHENLRLWTYIAGGVAADENALPEQLRAQLFYLAEFTRAHTKKVLKGEANAAALIDVNTAVLKGLRQTSGAM